MRLASTKTSIIAVAVFSATFLASAALVDTDGNPATNDTYLGDIDMAVGTVGDLSTFVTTGAVEQAVTQANAYTDTKAAGYATTNALAGKQDALTAQQLANIAAVPGKLSTSGGTVTGDISMPNGLLDAGDVKTRSYFDFSQPGKSPRYLDSPENSGKALTDADLQESSSALGAALAAKADDSDVVHTTGYEEIMGNKNFYGGIGIANGADIEFSYGGRVIIRSGDSVAVLNHDGIDYSTDGGYNYEHYDWPSASGTLALTSDIPTVPTSVSAFNNDAGYVTKFVTNGLLSTSTAAATYQPKGNYALASALAAAAAASTNHTDTTVAASATASTNYTDVAVLSAATAATNYTDSAAVAAVSTAVSTSKAYTDTSTNAVIQHVDAMDTSYYHFETITNVNQSVQYVATDANTTELRILMPATGMTKDWLVYVYPATNLNIVLPGPADYWCSSYDVTNSIPAGVPTALYFSQITEGVFSLGRKKLDCPITVSSPLTAKLRAAQAANRRAALTARRPTLTATALKTAAKPAATAAKPTAAAIKSATTNTTATATAPAKK